MAATPLENPAGFPSVLREELHQIQTRRSQLFPNSKPLPLADPSAKGDYEEAHRTSPFGVSFSGGGIRSATFNLGVAQGLAELGLLPYVDYLSTVSGGGYIGTWLHGVISRFHNGVPRDAA